MLRQNTLALGTTILASAWVLMACPSGGRLQNGELHEETVACPDTGELLTTYCAGSACHSPRPNRDPSTPKGGVDLTTPGGISAMVDAQATYPDIESSCPSGSNKELLINTSNPEKSLLYLKLTGQQTCGQAMPLSGAQPTAYEMYCLKQWALDLGKNPPSGSGGGSSSQGGASPGGAANGGAQ